MAVRATRPDEMLAIRPLAEEYHRESRYGHIPFSERKFKKHFLHTLDNPDDTPGVFIRHGTEVVGLLQANVGDHYLGEGGRMVTVLTFYIPRRVRETMLGGRITLKMMRILTDWAKAQRALEIHMHSTSGSHRGGPTRCRGGGGSGRMGGALWRELNEDAPAVGQLLLTACGCECWGNAPVGRVAP